MMKNSVLFTFAAALLLGACAEELADRPEPSTGVKEVNFRIHSMLPTRSGKDAFEVGDSIGIYAVKRMDPATVGVPSITGNQAHNAKWVKTAEGWEPATPTDKVLWAEDGALLDFYAYWPYRRAIERPDSMLFEVDAMLNADVLRAANIKGQNEGEVELAFEHAFSLVEVEILGEEIDFLPELSVKAINIQAKTAWNVGTGAIILSTDGATSVEFAVVDAEKRIFRVVLPPQVIAADVPFLQCDNGDAAYIYTPGEAIDLTAGSLQKMKITLQ